MNFDRRFKRYFSRAEEALLREHGINVFWREVLLEWVQNLRYSDTWSNTRESALTACSLSRSVVVALDTSPVYRILSVFAR